MPPPRLSSFTLVSGIGWCIDFAIFTTLVSLSLQGFKANLISASAAVTFVLVTARRWIFREHVESLPVVIGKYALWNAIAISAASFGIKLIADGLEQTNLPLALGASGWIRMPAITSQVMLANIAKILVTPFTMYANFVATGWIIERKLRFY